MTLPTNNKETTAPPQARKQYVWIVRYGRTEHTLIENIGPFNCDIDAEGRAHATAMGKRMRHDHDQGAAAPTVVYCSPFVRTTHTAQLIAQEQQSPGGGCPIRVEAGLCEWLTPSLLIGTDGIRTVPQSTDTLSTVYPSIDVAYTSINPPAADTATEVPEGVPHFIETEAALLQRCARTVQGVLQVDEGANIAIVSHAPCDQAIAFSFEGPASIEQSQLGAWPLGGLTLFSRTITTQSPPDSPDSSSSYGAWELELYGDTDHMPGEYQAGIKHWSLPCLTK